MSLKTIVLYGPAQCGKTHTLNILAGKFHKDFNGKILEKTSEGDASDDLDNNYSILLPLEGMDVIAIVTTRGDYKDEIICNNDFLMKYKKLFPDKDFFWFTASRTKGGTIECIENELELNPSDVLWIRKGYVYGNDESEFKRRLFNQSNELNAEILSVCLEETIRSKN